MSEIFHSTNWAQWGAFIGKDTAHGGESPEAIAFIPVAPERSSIKPMDRVELLTDCDVDDPLLRCGCSDCSLTCSAEASQIDLDAAFTESSGHDLFFYSVSLTCLVFMSIVLLSLLIQFCRRQFASADQDVVEPLLNEDEAASMCGPKDYIEDDDAGTSIDADVSEFDSWEDLSITGLCFYRFGLCIGSYPFLVMFTAFVIVILVGVLGIPKLVILEDPIKLWAPDGKSSIETFSC